VSSEDFGWAFAAGSEVAYRGWVYREDSAGRPALVGAFQQPWRRVAPHQKGKVNYYEAVCCVHGRKPPCPPVPHPENGRLKKALLAQAGSLAADYNSRYPAGWRGLKTALSPARMKQMRNAAKQIADLKAQAAGLPQYIFPCACGFYAYWNVEKAAPLWGGAEPVYMGAVEASGRVIAGPKGLRCGLARILALAPAVTPFTPEKVAGFVAQRLAEVCDAYDAEPFSSLTELARAYPASRKET
jgi:hypothetical protein